MKRLTRLILAAAGMAWWMAAAAPHATAQAPAPPDSAALTVDRYVGLTSFRHLPADSMVVAETEITMQGSTDTFLMKRWFAPPQMQRVEVWHGRQLTTALCTNGRDRYREYKPKLGYWVDLPADRFYERLSGYDIRGPLHSWRAEGCQLTYKGKVEAKGGTQLTVVKVEAPGHYTRDYLFEPSGLLALILENTEMMDSADYRRTEDTRIEWKIVHEYQYAGSLLLPRVESFMRQGLLTVLTTAARIEPRRSLLFNQD